MQKARQQVQYYFSEGNLADDAYLRSLMDSDGWVSLEKIMTFPRMKKHKLVIHEVAQVLCDSDSVEMTADLHRLRVRDVKLRASFPWQPWSEAEAKEWEQRGEKLKQLKRLKVLKRKRSGVIHSKASCVPILASVHVPPLASVSSRSQVPCAPVAKMVPPLPIFPKQLFIVPPSTKPKVSVGSFCKSAPGAKCKSLAMPPWPVLGASCKAPPPRLVTDGSS